MLQVLAERTSACCAGIDFGTPADRCLSTGKITGIRCEYTLIEHLPGPDLLLDHVMPGDIDVVCNQDRLPTRQLQNEALVTRLVTVVR